MNIVFKPHQKTEIELRVEWLNDPEISKYLVEKPTTLAEQIGWFEKYQKDITKKFFTIFADETPVGIIGLKNIDLARKSAEVFVMIGDKKYQNMGIGKKSLEYIKQFAKNLQIDELYLTVNKQNIPAIRCYHSAGFEDIFNKESANEVFMRVLI